MPMQAQIRLNKLCFDGWEFLTVGAELYSKKFLELFNPGINEKGLNQGRTFLLGYYKRDTLALVKSAHFLQFLPDTLISNLQKT